MPTTSAPWRVAAWIAKLPQPQPTSSTRSPGVSASLRQIVSSLRSWADSSGSSSRAGSSKIAHEYVIEASRKSAKKSLATS